LITDVGAALAGMSEDECPGHVIVVILTDGHENGSREWTREAVSAAIRRQETEYSWSFVSWAPTWTPRPSAARWASIPT
jgi:hypothetical protein